MAEGEKTVWLLGSGFSKPLGGPLLGDLFRQEREDDVGCFFPQHEYPRLAEFLPRIQRCFQMGCTDGLWENAEVFLAKVDEAYAGSNVPLQDRIRHQLQRADGEGRPTDSVGELATRFAVQVKRALASECHRFTMNCDPTSESWEPYRDWVKSLTPGVDTVISFNYDRVIEMAAEATGCEKKVHVVRPGRQLDPKVVPVLKLHGSIDWTLVLDPTDNKKILSPSNTPTADILKKPDDDIGIAAPGSSKVTFASHHLEPLWTMAEAALEEAQHLMVVGYSFPSTDSNARKRLLKAFSENPRKGKWAHTILAARGESEGRQAKGAPDARGE